MWEWMSENSSLVQAAVGAVTAMVWVIYLHIIVLGFQRQRRTEILIHLGGARDLNARILVSNLGFEPIYILEIMLTVWTDEGERMTSVADRTEIARDNLETPGQATLQGPLKSGDVVDIGSFENLLERARAGSFDRLEPGDIRRFEITVAAITAANAGIAAATRRFSLSQDGKNLCLACEGLYARQIRGRWQRRRIERQLKRVR
ncbi:hypothetical protein [Paracoccus tibetensis]|uniref:Uncharacterized protein n=1 Tax=Paracoccus tibetensis TaxID=336292 RepID=A0A1G5HZ39_9RHOB|nr:hypothetical protein [Paracoccus tibetensis]SCY68961.1 hypothetical protein SAMN05660710_02395 [Paracoccus tibetensis]